MNCGHRIIITLLTLPLLILVGVGLFCFYKQPDPSYTFSAASQIYLTDLALFCEAPHTRNPLLSDLQSAYREGPGAMEHSISSLFIPPPSSLKEADR